MDMHRDREDRSERGRGRSGVVALTLAAFLALAGCTDGLLDVEDPDTVTPGQLEGPSNVSTLLAGMVGDFQEGYDEYLLYSALFTDEAILAGTFPTRIDVDERNVVQTPGNASITDDIYQEMHTSRSSADSLVVRFEARLGDEEFSEVQGQLEEGIVLGEYYGAYDRMLFAEMFCQSIFGGEDGESAPLDSDARMQEALALFQEAETDAEAAGMDDVSTAARVGQARAQLWLGNHQQAAQLVPEGQVPTEFVFTAEYSANQTTQHNEFFQFSWGVIERLRWTVGDSSATSRHNEEYAYYDEWVDQGLIVPTPAGFAAEEAGIPVHLQTLYSEERTNALLASGWEARMIEAEAELRAGNPGPAEDIVNPLLTDPTVNPMGTINQSLLVERTIGGVTVPSMGPFDEVDFVAGDLQGNLQKLARARAAGLWLSGQRQGTARRFAEEFGDPFGLGLYPPGTEGTDLFFPVVDQELDNNGNIDSACP